MPDQSHADVERNEFLPRLRSDPLSKLPASSAPNPSATPAAVAAVPVPATAAPEQAAITNSSLASALAFYHAQYQIRSLSIFTF